MTVRVSLEVDSASIQLTSQQLSLKSTESPIAVRQQIVPANQQYNMITEIKTPISPSQFSMRAAKFRSQNASVEINQVFGENGRELLGEVFSFSSTSSAEFEVTSSLAPEYQIRVEVMVNSEISPASRCEKCSDRLFKNGKSLAEMNYTNFQDRLHTSRGCSDKVMSCKTSSWYFCIPYRPDTAGNQIH